MHKLSQLELLEEGFLDKVRTAGRAMKAVGKGIYALDPEGFNKLTAPLKTISSPVMGIAKGLYELTPDALKRSKDSSAKNKIKPTFDNVIAKYKKRFPRGLTVQQLTNILNTELNIKDSRAPRIVQGTRDIDSVILNVTGKTNTADILNDEDIKKVKTALRRTFIIESSNMSQKVLLEQLNNF